MSGLIRCMHDATGELAGGLAEVHFGDSVAPVPADHVQVIVAGGGGRYSAESYSTMAQRIRFCGHGALAAGWFVFDQVEPAADEIVFSNADRSWRARRAGSENVTLIYERPRPVAIEVPVFAAAALGAAAVAAAEVGGAEDYLVLEFSDAALVRQLQPVAERVTAATKRALIATAPDSAGCVYRYFAPQYGEPEDNATGSAAVQLGGYWAERMGAEPFTATQVSATGAVVQLICNGDTVEFTARVGYV